MDKLALLLLDKAVEQLSYANAATCIAISYQNGQTRTELERARDLMAAAELIIRGQIKPF